VRVPAACVPGRRAAPRGVRAGRRCRRGCQRALAPRGGHAQQRREALDVALDRLRLADVEATASAGPCRAVHGDAAEAASSACTRRRGVRNSICGRLRRAAAAALGLVEVQHLRPTPVELALRRAGLELDDERVPREHVEQRSGGSIPLARERVVRREVDRQDVDALQLARRALIENVELADRRDLVAPEFETHGLGRAEAEEVEDAAAQRVLADGLDQRRALEAESPRAARRARHAHLRAGLEREPQLGQAGRHLGALLQRAGGRDEDADAAGEQRLERLDAQTADLDVVLGRLVRQRLALRKERGAAFAENRVEVGFERLGNRRACGATTTKTRCGSARARAARAGSPRSRQAARGADGRRRFRAARSRTPANAGCACMASMSGVCIRLRLVLPRPAPPLAATMASPAAAAARAAAAAATARGRAGHGTSAFPVARRVGDRRDIPPSAARACRAGQPAQVGCRPAD
jgi:hypothetical protein